jgi:hypothetical protein
MIKHNPGDVDSLAPTGQKRSNTILDRALTVPFEFYPLGFDQD